MLIGNSNLAAPSRLLMWGSDVIIFQREKEAASSSWLHVHDNLQRRVFGRWASQGGSETRSVFALVAPETHHKPNKIKDHFTPRMMKSDHGRWPLFMVSFHGSTSMVWFFKKLIYKVFGPFTRCKLNVDWEEWPCTQKVNVLIFVLYA